MAVLLLTPAPARAWITLRLVGPTGGAPLASCFPCAATAGLWVDGNVWGDVSNWQD